MPQEKLRVISGPKRTGPWFRDPKAPPLYTGGGDVDYVCGNCGDVVATAMEPGRLGGVEVTCRACDTINRFPLDRE